MRNKGKPWICISPSTGAMLARHLLAETARLHVGPLGRLFLPTRKITERAAIASSYCNRANALASSLAGTAYAEIGRKTAQQVNEAMLSLHRLSLRRKRKEAGK